MEEKKFQKQKLNRDDHKKVDNAAKVVRAGFGVLGVLTFVGTVAYKVVKAVGKTATKL